MRKRSSFDISWKDNIMKKFIYLILIFCIVGCSKKGNTKRTNIVLLHGYGSMENSDITMRRIYEDFEIENPDISMTLVSVPSFDKVEDKLNDMLSIGKIPNIIYTEDYGRYTSYPFMIENNYIVDLGDYIENDIDLKNSIPQDVLDSWKENGGTKYTISDRFKTYVLWYNEMIFENVGIDNPPSNWEEFKDCCIKISEWAKNSHYNTIPISLNANMVADIVGNEEIENNEKLEIFLKEILEISQYVGFSDTKSFNEDSLSDFSIGHAAMYIGDISDYKKFPKNLNAKHVVLPNDNKALGVRREGGIGYLISNSGDEKQIEASIRFLKYMLSEKVQKKIFYELGYLPSNPNIDIETLISNDVNLYSKYKLVKKNDNIVKSRWTDRSYRYFTSNIGKYLNKSMILEYFLTELERYK